MGRVLSMPGQNRLLRAGEFEAVCFRRGGGGRLAGGLELDPGRVDLRRTPEVEPFGYSLCGPKAPLLFFLLLPAIFPILFLARRLFFALSARSLLLACEREFGCFVRNPSFLYL